jgi:ATP-dependent RNA helicase SUPV3L1/SUV3
MFPNRPVTAVLGPTNTGKTHLAVERMLAHATGMIGLPLRLLAREIYDRVRLRMGDPAVALVTGEEKIVPANPRFWVATVEAMPPDVDPAFLAIDEVQLAADFERGHIFTDRILHRRGREETMLLGADTMRPMIEKLLPDVSFVSRPRFSKLSYAGQKKVSRLPPRSAIVAFSAETVYATAELIRRQRGGAAVVLGALSPRTRNAQVALYQSGDVDYVVATDAIGMGLNMDIDHVAFAGTRKFDGFHFRELAPAELAQVAGRAGRYMNDGTFGVTAAAEPFDTGTVEALEAHRFDAVRMLQWRNHELDFASLERLRRSLGRLPHREGLTRAQSAPDVTALESLSNDDETVALANSPAMVERLWEVCQLPDYRNISPSEHAGLIGRIFGFLASGKGRIPDDWFQRQLAHCDRSEGDIDTLSNRIAHVRTWTFAANRADWLEAPIYWQGRARDIEDKLSDALHERLIQRFIDRRTSVLMKRLAQKEELMTTVEDDGAIHVEGEYVGKIVGLRFIPDGAGEGSDGKTLKAVSLKAAAQEIAARALAVAACADPALSLTRDGEVHWQRAAIAKLAAGPHLLKPRIEIVADDQLESSAREAIHGRIEKWLGRHLAAIVEPLVKLKEAEGLEGIVRGLAFRLVENLGVVPREQVAEEVKSLSQDDRAKLRAFGIRFGAFHIFAPAMLKPAAVQLRLLLWALGLAKDGKLDLEKLPEPPGQGLTSAAFDRTTPRGFYGLCGYRICGERVVRIDMLERLADLLRERVFWRPRFDGQPRPQGSIEGGGFSVVPDMMSLVGCSGDQFKDILKSLGFRMQTKKVKRPAVAAPVPAEAVAAPEATAAVDPVSDSVEGPPSPELSDATLEATPEESAAEDVPAAEELPADVTPPDETPAPADAAVSPQTVLEEIEIEVWWPKDTGPFRHHAPKKPHCPPHKKPQRADGAKKEPRPEKPREPVPIKPRRQEKPVDPDSPFAVLGALKERLAAKP